MNPCTFVYNVFVLTYLIMYVYYEQNVLILIDARNVYMYNYLLFKCSISIIAVHFKIVYM